MDVTPLGILKLLNASQLRKAKHASVELTVLDAHPNDPDTLLVSIVTLVNELQPWNTCTPTESTPLGSVTEVSELRP